MPSELTGQWMSDSVVEITARAADDDQPTVLEPPPGKLASRAKEKLPFDPVVEVSFACPECGHTCHVAWEHLSGGVHCPACESSFHILPDRLQKHSLPGPAELTFPCPRCRQAIKLPVSRIRQRMTCPGCELELLPGPDNKLHDRHELKEMKIQSRQRRLRPSPAPFAGFDAARGKLVMIGTGVGLALLLLVWIGYSIFHTPTVEATAQNFTHACALGQGERAARFVLSEDHQQKEFEHWRILHFSSLSVAVKSAGDSPRIVATVVEDETSRRVLRVELTSSVVGRRTFTQIWQKEASAESWRFDPIATLKNLHAADGTHSATFDDAGE